MLPEEIAILLTNLKNYPWHLYPEYKIDEKTGKALLELLSVEEGDDEQ